MVAIGCVPERLAAVDLARLAAPLQADAERFQVYFGEDVDQIVAEIEGVTAWREHAVVALDGDRLVGWLIAEHDDELGRVWWWGPVVSGDQPWPAIGDRLVDAALELLGGRFAQFEFAVDARHAAAIELGLRRGYRRDKASVLLCLEAGSRPAPRSSPEGVEIASLSVRDGDAVAALHDALFPGTHYTGRQIVDSAVEAIVLVALLDDRVAGYLRAEIQGDRDGFVDFVGVDPDTRGRGIGRALVVDAIAALDAGGAHDVSLTVREDNVAARALYASLGFDGSRILVPLRSGFGPA